MRNASHVFLLAMLATLSSGCTTYIGIAKSNDAVYLTGTTSFIFSKSWVRRCTELGGTLQCVELKVSMEKNDDSSTKPAKKIDD